MSETTAARGARRMRSTARSPRSLVIAVDGPAGAGKSTVSKGVARALGMRHIDTGAMYRAITWKALSGGVDPSDGPTLAALARQTTLDYGPEGLIVDGVPAGAEIRTRRVNQFVSVVAAHPEVRRALVRRQREIARTGDAVIEGRDIGTVVCPDAPLKVFLTASPAERARRRHRELARDGTPIALDTLRRQLARRDTIDATRTTSPLIPAKDAVVVDSTGRTARQVIAQIVALARRIRDERA